MLKLLLGIVVALVVLAGVALALVFAGVLDSEFSERGSVGGRFREVVVRSDSGDVELVSGSRVEYDASGHFLFDRPKLTRDTHDGVLTLALACKGSAIKCGFDMRLTVPAGVKVTVEADSGDVRARGLDVRGAHLRTDSGDVTAKLSGRTGLVWAHTDSGSVEVDATGARAIDAQSDSGDVSVDATGNPRKIVAHTDSGDVDVAVPAGAWALRADTDSGEVDVERAISRDAAAARSIDAATDSGDVTVTAR